MRVYIFKDSFYNLSVVGHNDDKSAALDDERKSSIVSSVNPVD